MFNAVLDPFSRTSTFSPIGAYSNDAPTPHMNTTHEPLHTNNAFYDMVSHLKENIAHRHKRGRRLAPRIIVVKACLRNVLVHGVFRVRLRGPVKGTGLEDAWSGGRQGVCVCVRVCVCVSVRV